MQPSEEDSEWEKWADWFRNDLNGLEPWLR
jgi:hypothetical protein